MHDRSSTSPGEAGEPTLPDESVLHNTLIVREREILSLIAQGRANKEIAEMTAFMQNYVC